MPVEHQQDPSQDDGRKSAQAIWAELDAEDSGQEPVVADDATTDGEGDHPKEPAPKQVEQQPTNEQPKGPAGTVLSDEERALLKQIPEVVQLVKATVGRVGSIQSQLATMGKVAATQQGAGDKPSEQQISKAAANPEKWDALKKDFPDWAEGVEALLSTRIPSASPAVDPQALAKQIEGQFAQRLQQQREEDAMETVSMFDADWKSKAASKEFSDWIKTQPAEYQQRALNTWKPTEILRTMKDFDAARQPAPAQKPDPRLSKSVIPRAASRPNLAKPVEEMSDKEYWAYLDAQDKRQSRAA